MFASRTAPLTAGVYRAQSNSVDVASWLEQAEARASENDSNVPTDDDGSVKPDVPGDES
jgi:hypothetical protein